MCTGKCSKFIGACLYPFAFICIISNLILFFPDWSTEYIKDAGTKITQEVRSVGGIVGGGIMILIPAIHIYATGKKGCCNNRWGMLLSILFAVIGAGGAAFCLVMSIVGMLRGPVCRYDPDHHGNTDLNVTKWDRPFDNELRYYNNESYIFNKDLWDVCIEPAGVVEFNIILFSILLAASGIELILCAIQIVNGIIGTLCGTCQKKEKGSEKNDKEKILYS